MSSNNYGKMAGLSIIMLPKLGAYYFRQDYGKNAKVSFSLICRFKHVTIYLFCRLWHTK